MRINPGTPVAATICPGPDDFGYAGTAIAFDLCDVSASGTEVLLPDDDFSGAIPLPFAFDFYGVGQTQLFICSNGYVVFDFASASS